MTETESIVFQSPISPIDKSQQSKRNQYAAAQARALLNCMN